jgi:hypothetical protein
MAITLSDAEPAGTFFLLFLSWLMLKGRKLILWLHVEGVTLTVSTFHPMPIEKDPAG